MVVCSCFKQSTTTRRVSSRPSVLIVRTYRTGMARLTVRILAFGTRSHIFDFSKDCISDKHVAFHWVASCYRIALTHEYMTKSSLRVGNLFAGSPCIMSCMHRMVRSYIVLAEQQPIGRREWIVTKYRGAKPVMSCTLALVL
jgi:hypothetical protein